MQIIGKRAKKKLNRRIIIFISDGTSKEHQFIFIETNLKAKSLSFCDYKTKKVKTALNMKEVKAIHTESL
jgi:hypothetical protein